MPAGADRPPRAVLANGHRLARPPVGATGAAGGELAALPALLWRGGRAGRAAVAVVALAIVELAVVELAVVELAVVQVAVVELAVLCIALFLFGLGRLAGGGMAMTLAVPLAWGGGG